MRHFCEAIEIFALAVVGIVCWLLTAIPLIILSIVSDWKFLAITGSTLVAMVWLLQ